MFACTLGPWLVAVSLCLLPLHSSASTSVEALLWQAEVVRSSDPGKFQQLLQELDASKSLATPTQREQLAYLKAYGEAYVGNYHVAIAATRRLLETSSSIDMQFRAGASLVNSYAVTRQFTEGLRQLEQTLSLIDQIHEPELRQHGLFVAAVLYNQIGQYKLGLDYADRSMSEPAPERTRCFIGQVRLEALQNLDALPADDESITRLIGQCVDQHEAILANFIRGTLARKWAEKGQRAKAIALLQEHLAEVEATRYPRLVGEFHSLLAELLFKQGDIAGAERHAQTAIAQRADMTHSLPLVVAYKTMYNIAEHRGDPVAALAHYRSYAEADKAYLNEVKTRELAYQFVRQETAQKTQQIELLNGQNQLLQLRQRVDQQTNQNTRLMMLLLALMVALIGYWAYKIKRVQMSLRHIAETDALTGISNRHHFTQQAEQALAQSATGSEQCALIMFDLDHFKTINDSYGHDIGDWVLKRVARTCEGLCRRIDHFGRLGGEEFAILLRGIDLHSATRLAEDCRVRLTQIDSRESGHAFVITASFGVTATPLSGYSLAKLLSHADQMLYSGKRAGRNRVHAFTGDLFNPSQLQVVSRSEALSPMPTHGAAGVLGDLSP